MHSLSVRPRSLPTSTSTSSRRPLSPPPLLLLSRSASKRKTPPLPAPPRAEYRPRGDDGRENKVVDGKDSEKKDEVKTAAAPDPRRRRPSPAKREQRQADADGADGDEGDGEEEVSLASVYASAGIGLMINASGFAAVYRLSPGLKILAGLIEEKQDPALFAFFAKVGTILASPVDIFLLTVCLLLIEFMKWLNDE